MRSKNSECENLRRNLFVLKEKQLEIDLTAALDKIKMLEDDLKKFNTSSSKLTTMLGASKNHRDTRGLGYKGIDASNISK